MRTPRVIGIFVASVAIAGLSAGVGAKTQTITISGCLQGPPPTQPAFRLTNATTIAPPSNGVTYFVIGAERQLRAQIGHRVRIVGTLLDPDGIGTIGTTGSD